jgi:hypothetical protein
MKVSKENVQKIILGAIVCAGFLYYYTAQMLDPLTVREKVLTGQIRDLEAKIRDGRSKIAQARVVQGTEATKDEAQTAYAIMQEKIPSAQPIAWLPTRLGELFKARGLAKQNYHCETSGSNTGIPGFHSSTWVVDFPAAPFSEFGSAVAGLENEDGLSQITKFQVSATSKDPQNHHAQFTFSTLVKNEK